LEWIFYTFLEPHNTFFPYQRHAKQTYNFSADADNQSNGSNFLALQWQREKWEQKRYAKEYAGKSNQEQSYFGS